jgi:hypothetical protein
MKFSFMLEGEEEAIVSISGLLMEQSIILRFLLHLVDNASTPTEPRDSVSENTGC